MINILIVDDSKTICATLETLIQEELGFNPIVAHSKQECEEKLIIYKNEISVALLDLGLDDAPNGEVIDSVSKFNIPSIVLTGSQTSQHILKDKNIVDYVIKEGRFAYEYILNLIKRIVTNYRVKVLIADDSRVVAKKTIDLLRRYQLTCYYAKDGKEALNILEKDKNIKILFTDYDMPNMNGLELTKQIRANYSKDTLSIITLTGSKERSEIVARFLKYGANDFLSKGCSEEEFFATLNSNLETLELFEEIKNKANKDYMTGMFNRRYFFDEGQALYQDALLMNQNICVAMFDIDKFKNINDTYGHDIGDIAICEVAKIVSKYFTNNAIISRFGGEEFCIIKVDTEESAFLETLEKIRKEFEINKVNTPKGEIQYTVSIGYSINTGNSLGDMVSDADIGLYNAKNNGRNQIRKSS